MSGTTIELIGGPADGTLHTLPVSEAQPGKKCVCFLRVDNGYTSRSGLRPTDSITQEQHSYLIEYRLLEQGFGLFGIYEGKIT